MYPKCPICGASSVSAESGNFEYVQRGSEALIRNFADRHPLIKVAEVALSLGHQVYKRVPGGGLKRCTNPKCSHTFR